jgi:hypothetical protein
LQNTGRSQGSGRKLPEGSEFEGLKGLLIKQPYKQ